MSNKLRNNFSRFFLLLFILSPIIELASFEPQQDDFVSDYQYSLYRSWLQKSGFKENFPAGFASNKIVKTFSDRNGNEVQVEYDWIERKISDQRESLPVVFFTQDYSKIKPFIKFLEGFIYRLNTTDFTFLKDYCDLQKFELQYSTKSGQEALLELWQDHTENRAEIEPLELDVEEDFLTFTIPFYTGETLKIMFPIDYDIASALKNIQLIEKEKIPPVSIAKKNKDQTDFEQSREYKVYPIKPKPDPATLPSINTLTLAEYVKSYHNVRHSRELLHNKISDPLEFLLTEFPDRTINKTGSNFFIELPKFNDDFPANLQIRLVMEADGINFKPIIDYYVENGILIFGEDEKVNLNSLDQHEIEQIAPFIAHLVYEHRAVGSRLLNFLLVHDDTPTTLIMRDGNREIYEMDSYANLLLMLNRYWQKRDIYFKVQEVTKKSGHIEFQTYLIAVGKDTTEPDMAEILFRLDNDFKIDMSMMILHQGSDRIDQ